MSRLPREDERIARLLDGAEPPRDVPSARLVAVTDRLRAAGRDVDLDPDVHFRAELRARLLAQAPGELPRPRTPDGPDSPHAVLARTYRRTPAAPVRPPVRPAARPPARAARSERRLRTRRNVLVSAALVGAALSASTMVASHDSLPGQPLYKVKLTVENVEATLTRDPGERGKVHLAQARSRAEEIGRVAATPGHPDDLVGTLEAMDRLTRLGFKELATAAVSKPDATALSYLGTWLTDQQSLVDRTYPALPGSARLRVTQSLSLLHAASRRVDDLEVALPECRCPTPRQDELGPLPENCPGCPPATGIAAPTRAATGSASGPVPSGPAGPPAASGASPAPRPGSTPAGGQEVPAPPAASPPAPSESAPDTAPSQPADPGATEPPASEPETPAPSETPPPLIDLPGIIGDIVDILG